VVVGECTFDIAMKVPVIPSVDEWALSHSAMTMPGGKGLNQAVALSRLGARPVFVSRIGNDYMGQSIQKLCQQENIGRVYLKVDRQKPTSIVVILIDASGRNLVVANPGANMNMSEEDILSAAQEFSDADALLMPLTVPLEVAALALEMANSYGVKSVVSPISIEPIPEGIMKKIDILVCNSYEAGLVSGIEVKAFSDAKMAASRIIQKGTAIAVVTLGAAGALVADSDNISLIKPFVVEAVDTTGAGDAFSAALTFAITQGKDLKEATRYGCAAGAIASTKLGTSASMPTHREVLSLFEPTHHSLGDQ